MVVPRFWMSNQTAYNAKEVVEYFAMQTDLQKPEQTILKLLTENIRNGRMLDIGVGAGRTTYHFAPLVQEYIGIDYSERMIETCQRKFHPVPPNICFKVCDAKAMGIFKDGYFDLVLASFNCIDYMCHSERIKTLREIRRTCKRGGLVCFSSHNLQCDDLFKIKGSRNPLKLLLAIYRHAWLLALNRFTKQLASKDYATINDGAHNFRLKTYYIKPTKQIEQLKELGFRDIRMFSLDGNELAGGSEAGSLKDCWLYYLSTAV
jgi:ubiquinone/menaquinone biosynthesis C-methylase UbiE